MKNIFKLILFFTFIFSASLKGKSQIFGVYLGPSVRKPMFTEDTLVRAGFQPGIAFGIGFIPGKDHDFKFTFDFNYTFPKSDSVLVELTPEYNWGNYSNVYDVASVTQKAFTISLSFGTELVHDFNENLHLAINLDLSGTILKFEYNYSSDPFWKMTQDTLVKTGNFYVGPQLNAYYDLGKTTFFLNSSLHLSPVTKKIKLETHYRALNSPFLFMLSFGLLYRM
jgi:outer membrane receptor protein involved in Fe transport